MQSRGWFVIGVLAGLTAGYGAAWLTALAFVS
jgi:hypothetical protein